MKFVFLLVPNLILGVSSQSNYPSLFEAHFAISERVSAARFLFVGE